MRHYPYDRETQKVLPHYHSDGIVLAVSMKELNGDDQKYFGIVATASYQVFLVVSIL
jgi:hypothetical protein